MAAPDESTPTPARADRPLPVPCAVEFDIGAEVARSDIPLLCQRARALLEGADADRLVCDVGSIATPDAVTVDAIARLQLTAHRLGREVRFQRASPDLCDLLAFMGLSEVVPLYPGSGVQAGRQPEEREELGSVEEEADPADPAV